MVEESKMVEQKNCLLDWSRKSKRIRSMQYIVMGKNIKTTLQNQGLKLLVWLLWFGANVYLFTSIYLRYRNSDKYHYMYMVLKESICISRACAMALNLNCALILLPMCRTMNSWIRTKLLKYLNSNPRRLINHMKGLHIMCAYSICILGVVHSLSHLVNCMRFHLNFTDAIKGINASSAKKNITLWWFIMQIPGWSGILMLLILVAIVISSFHAVRRQRFEIFWYTHHLSLFFLGLVCIHGAGGITKYQTNLKEHPRACHNIQEKTWMKNSTMCMEEPMFESNEPETWKWIIGPMCLYIIDRMIRLYRGLKTCKIVKVTLHEGKVIELHMLKKSFKCKPGQYILLQCPDIAEFEWHAFTLTKCPTSKEGPGATFSVHIKVTGDWTKALLQLLITHCKVNEIQLKRVGDTCLINLDDQTIDLPMVRVDGPYGSPNEDCFRYPVNISVAAGIGVTPFAATLNYLRYFDPNLVDKSFKMKRMYLVWVCRDIKEFTWFLNLMVETSQHLESINLPDMLVCKLFVTKDAILAEDDPSMSNHKMQWFQQRLNYGRPKFEDVLKSIALNYYKQRIGVFFCGPNPLAETVYKSCTMTKYRGNAFIFHKESFA